LTEIEMAEFLDSKSIPWHPVRPEITRDVSGKILLNGPTKAVLTRVAPGGRFAPHRDPYAHLFYILEGEGRVSAGTEERAVGPGSVVRVPAGELHGYENTGTEEMILLSLNLPE
jgi:quercetin dioxygenase-like cupin family protein